jgi:hypothetical protein
MQKSPRQPSLGAYRLAACSHFCSLIIYSMSLSSESRQS